MSAPATTQEFLDVCRKSGIVEEKYLSEVGTPLPANPMAAAKALMRINGLTKFQASQLLAGKYKGLRFDRLKILDRLGTGGMGTVFLCEHLGLRRNVAVKMLPPEMAGDEGTRERFYREARAAAVLDHPNIVRIYDVNNSNGLHYIVMEYVDGQDLQTIINRYGPLSANRATTYIAQAALGLQHAYEKGLVHRDIKPANLLVDKEGTVKILDMGLARFSEDRTDNLTAKYDRGAVLGTADYMAPEQIMNSSEVDIRADIYSLGATLYTLVNGKPPFSGSATQKLIGHQTQKAASLTTIRREVPKGLSEVVDRMLEKQPDKRFQTPAEVVQALTPWLEAETLAMESPSTRRLLPPSAKRLPQATPETVGRPSRKPLFIGSVVAILAVVGIAFAVAGRSTKPDGESQVKNDPLTNGSGTSGMIGGTTPNPKDGPGNDANPVVGERLIHRFDAATAEPYQVQYTDGKATSRTGTAPRGWDGHLWSPRAGGSIGRENYQGSPVIALRTTVGESSAEWRSSSRNTFVRFIPGRDYRVVIEYANPSKSPGGLDMRFDQIARPSEKLASLPSTNGEWGIVEHRFTCPEHHACSVFIVHPGATLPSFLAVRSVAIYETARPNASGTALLDARFDDCAVRGTVTKANTTVEEGTLPEGCRPVVWHESATGGFASEVLEGRTGLGIWTESGILSSQLHYTGPQPIRVSAGRRYLLTVDYATAVGGKLDARVENFQAASDLETQLPPTGGKWNTVELSFRPAVDSSLKLYFSNIAHGKTHALVLGRIRVTETADAPASSSLFQLEPLRWIGVRLKTTGTKIVSSTGTLPEGIAMRSTEPLSTGELSVETVAGTPVLTFRNVEGPGKVFLTGPTVNIPDSRCIDVTIEYRTDKNSRGELRVGDRADRIWTYGTLPDTDGKWSTRKYRVRATLSKATQLQFGILNLTAGGRIQIRSLQFDAVGEVASMGGSPSVANPPNPVETPRGSGSKRVFRLTLDSIADCSHEVTRTDGVGPNHKRQLMEGWIANCWGTNDTGRIAVLTHREAKAIALTNISGKTVQLYSARTPITLVVGTKLSVKVTYASTATADATNFIELRGPGNTRFSKTTLPPTGGEWRSTEFDAESASAGTLAIYVQSLTEPDGGSLMIRSIEVTERD